MEQQAKYDAAVAAGEVYIPEQKETTVVDFAPFTTIQKKYVLCIDTMG